MAQPSWHIVCWMFIHRGNHLCLPSTHGNLETLLNENVMLINLCWKWSDPEIMTIWPLYMMMNGLIHFACMIRNLYLLTQFTNCCHFCRHVRQNSSSKLGLIEFGVIIQVFGVIIQVQSFLVGKSCPMWPMIHRKVAQQWGRTYITWHTNLEEEQAIYLHHTCRYDNNCSPVLNSIVGRILCLSQIIREK